MEVELVRFIGAGLASSLAGLTSGGVRGHGAEGFSLIDDLAREHPPALANLIEKCGLELVRGWRASGIPDPVAEQHFAALPAVLRDHGPEAKIWSSAVAKLAIAAHDGKVADALGRSMAANAVAAAASAGTLAAAGLLVEVSFELLHRLFSSLLLSARDLRSLAPIADRLFDAAKPGAEPAGALHSAGTSPSPLLSALVASEVASGSSQETISLGLEAKSLACRELLGDLAMEIESTGDIDLRAEFKRFRDFLERGDLDRAYETLAVGEDVWAARPYPNEIGAGGNLAAEALRRYRGRLNELRGNWREAARDYALARKFCAALDVKGRWRLMMRQAASLTRHGVATGDTSSFTDAVQIHAEAGGLLQEDSSPIEWATGYLELGNLLLMLAEREGRPERYLAAALHFKPAGDVFSREGETDSWAQAQLGLARTHHGQGEHQGDPIVLADAAFGYRAALGAIHAGRSPEEWMLAKVGLGSVLVRLAEETGDADHIDEAISALQAALTSQRLVDKRPIEATLGRAYILLAAERDDVTPLVNAVEKLQNALQGDQPFKAADTATLLRLLGTSLWALGEADNDHARLQSALGTLEAARAQYAADGEPNLAETIAKEISRCELQLARRRQMHRHGA